jgi:hypothetical protein
VTVPPSRFTEQLVRLNALHFRGWLTKPGMSFGAEEKWWGDGGARGMVHNGLDVLWYETDDGCRGKLDAGTRIPILYKGTIVKTFADFLGFTVVASHDRVEGRSRLFTLYGHVHPAPGCVAGARVGEGEVIASLAGAQGRVVPAHLHLSAAFVPQGILPGEITWKVLDGAPGVRFLDPRGLIEGGESLSRH